MEDRMKKMMKWKKEWSLGHKEIDNQHKCLLSLMNEIQLGVARPETLINDFIEYATKHFLEEEKLMFENNYPKELYEAHKKEHKYFKDVILELSFRYIKANSNAEIDSMFERLKQFASDWLEYHFLKTDKQFTEFLKGGADK